MARRSGVLVAIVLSSILLAISVGATALSIAWPVQSAPDVAAFSVASEPLPPAPADTAAVRVDQKVPPTPRAATPPHFPPPEVPPAALEEAQRTEQERRLRAQQAQFEAWAHREAQASMAEDDARVRRRAADQRAANALGSGQVLVTMYSASWCKVCSAARSYMQQAQIPFTERDIDEDPSARATLRQLNPQGSVPTFDVGGTPLIGFRAESLNRAIAAAARR